MSNEQPPVFVALIPARKGSKGIIRKNTRNICGKALIEYTIEAAVKADSLHEIYVSSDDQEVEQICSRHPLQFIERPASLAGDHATANDVIKHFISFLPSCFCNENTFIIYLQPTSPLRNEVHIEKAIKLLRSKKAQSIISLTECENKLWKCFVIGENGFASSVFDETLSNKSRQDLPKIFMPNGAIYGFSVVDFMNRKSIPSNGSWPLLMDKRSSLDIDSLDDLALFERYLQS
jgi:CMP-N,N'-diacetyllegionaminic acid synthase